MGIQNWSDEIILVSLAAEPQMSEELDSVAEIAFDRGDCDVVVDFSQVDIVTSSSLSKLLRLRKCLDDNDRKLVLCSIQEKTKGVFLVTGLESVFEFAADQFIALAGLQVNTNNA